MAFSSDSSSRHNSLINFYLYSSSFSSNTGSRGCVLMIPATSGLGKIEMYSSAFYVACADGGILSCGLTHMVVTPLDIVKCNMQEEDDFYFR